MTYAEFHERPLQFYPGTAQAATVYEREPAGWFAPLEVHVAGSLSRSRVAWPARWVPNVADSATIRTHLKRSHAALEYRHGDSNAGRPSAVVPANRRFAGLRAGFRPSFDPAESD